jgi:23S rRNA pseudouridine2604 synthase
MSSGIPILDTITKQCEVQKLSTFEFKIILTQGLNRQIRRMCEYLNYEVQSLKRTRIMNIHLKSELGSYRDLTDLELSTLNETLKDSKKSI